MHLTTALHPEEQEGLPYVQGVPVWGLSANKATEEKDDE